MQFRPRLTGASGSPWQATTRPCCVPTNTPQPVPQKRHGALSHLMASCCPTTARATPGTLRPAAAAAAATALAFIKLRRLSFMVFPHLAHPAGDKPATPPVRPRHCVLTQLFASAFHSNLLPPPQSVARFQRRLTRLRNPATCSTVGQWRRCSDFWPARPGYRPAS